jgi:ABC-2 type transport system permease protein
VPIVLASAFGLIFDRQGQRAGACRLPLLVVVEDDSPFTRSVVDGLRNDRHVDLREVDRATAEGEAANRNGVAIVFPTGFRIGQHFEKPQIEVLHHPLSALESQWAEGVITEAVMNCAAREYLEPLGVPAAAVERPFAIRRTPIPSEAAHPFNTFSHSFSGMTLQYLLFWGMECGLLLLRERQRGIWRRIQAAPVSLTAALLGRALSTAIVALLQVLVTFAFGHVVFGVSITGSWLGFAMLVLAVSILAAGVGLLTATVGGTEARARNIFIVVILGVSMLGGLWLPSFLLPRWAQDWSLALPTSWAMRGLDGVTWQGESFAGVLPHLLAVISFAAGFLVLAMIRFHWSEARCRRGVDV